MEMRLGENVELRWIRVLLPQPCRTLYFQCAIHRSMMQDHEGNGVKKEFSHIGFEKLKSFDT